LNIRRSCFTFLIIFCAAAKPALAQGCATCYRTAAAGGPQTAHALRSGILVLLIPPVLIFAGIILLLRRWRVLDLRGNPDPALRLNQILLHLDEERGNREQLGYAAWPQAEIASNSEE